MFSKILVANRGEIAVRVVRACRELGIRTVAVYSEADRDSLAVRMADEAVCIGPPPSIRSYLNIPNIVSAALLTGADAIHPGYGFLSENPYMADICERYGITFIGPSPAVIEGMSDKANARQRMRAAGLPVVPGTDQAVESLPAAVEAAESVGYPVVLKAVAGGGGRGMRVAQSEEDLVRGYAVAQAEAEASFGNSALYVERYLEDPRHIEVQVLVDNFGKAIHLYERDCSIQRRHQKIIEEAPSPRLAPELRQAMGDAAVKGVLSVAYTNAGTVEFLLDKQGSFYFLEMNTRVQVEHPVTESITGVDIVKWQIRIAAGAPLTLEQGSIPRIGHAIECRVNAEDPENSFMPEAGAIDLFVPPGGPGVRVDSHLFSGYTAPAYYDSLLAKVIAWGENRDEALQRMRRALDECVIAGVKTTIPFHQQVLKDPLFLSGEVHTNFVQRCLNGRY